MNTFDFTTVVIGGGCIGSSILFELSRRGFQNLALLDQGNESQNATLQSGGMTRVFHENAEHLDLALQSHFKSKQLKNEKILTEMPSNNGSLYFFDKKRYPSYQKNLQRMDEAEYPFEILTFQCGEKKFPQFEWNENEWAVFEPLGSQLSTRQFVKDLQIASQKQKAVMMNSFEVQRIFSHQGQFRLYGKEATVTCKNLILAGGAALIPRFKDLGIHLPLQSRLLTSYIAEKSTSDQSCPNYFDRETLEYAGFGRNDSVTLSELKVKKPLQQSWSSSFKIQSGNDCYAPNRKGVLGQVSGHDGLYIATGWGGTAFKFALEIANQTANILENSQSEGVFYGNI